MVTDLSSTNYRLKREIVMILSITQEDHIGDLLDCVLEMEEIPTIQCQYGLGRPDRSSHCIKVIRTPDGSSMVAVFLIHLISQSPLLFWPFQLSRLFSAPRPSAASQPSQPSQFCVTRLCLCFVDFDTYVYSLLFSRFRSLQPFVKHCWLFFVPQAIAFRRLVRYLILSVRFSEGLQRLESSLFLHLSTVRSVPVYCSHLNKLVQP